MNFLNKRVIKEVLKEEVEIDKTLVRILKWYNDWESKLKSLTEAGDYAKIIDTHFKYGLLLIKSMKNFSKHNPNSLKDLKEKMGTLRDKLIVINNARKSIDSIK